ncbi:MAG: 2OG-Fe dioxygenase family protein [Chloroflexota bacterium]
MNNPISLHLEINADLQKNKYALASGDQYSFQPNLISDMEALKASWGTLVSDNYLKDGAAFRERRFGLFYFMPNLEDLVLLPPADYFQSAETNTYAGGVSRQFEPLLEETSSNQFLHNLIKLNFQQFPVESHMTNQPWEIDVHQFRIIGTKGEEGEPTPEGIHHDDDEFNVIHLMKRENAKGGKNGVYDNEKNLIASTTLEQFMDSVFVWDPHVMHGVSPIYPEDSTKPAIRDVMVIGYNFKPDLQRPA